MSTVSARQETQTPTQTPVPPYFAVMCAMRKDGWGYEDIHVELKTMGFSVSLDDCRRFVIPKARRPLDRPAQVSQAGARGMRTQD